MKLPDGYTQCRCGFAYRNGARWCRSCGRSTGARADAPAAPAVQPEPTSAAPAKPVKAKKGSGPNKTEAAYRSQFLNDHAIYEGITLKLRNGHRYTADFVEPGNGKERGPVLHEVKGSYRFGSHQRAKLAFDQARIDYPCFRFVWAEQQKNKSWKIT